MITFEATYNSGIIKEITLPQNWSEVTWQQYVDLINHDTGSVEKRLAILLGLELDDVVLFETDLLFKLIFEIGFTYDLETLLKHNVAPEKYKDWYIGHQPWFKLEKCKQALSGLDGKDIMNAGAEIVKVYTDEDINDKPVTEVLGAVSFFLNRSIIFMNAILN